MNDNIRFSKQSLKYLARLHKPKRLQILSAIENLSDGDTKKLIGKRNLYRLRVNDYRVVYSPSGDIINITRIGSRGEIYKWIMIN